MENLILQIIRALLSLLGNMFRLLGETTRRTILLKFLHAFIQPLWCSMPNLSRFTYIAVVDQNLMTFRPLVLSDLLLVLADRDKEPYVQRIFRPKPGETVVDVGAHIGFYTLKAARDVGPKGTVIAIEPDPQNFLLLKKNIAINHLHNVIAINVALSDADGQRLFYACADPSKSCFNPSSRTRIRDVKTVRTMTLDKLLQSLGIDRIDWIKVDVEGEDVKVLKGGRRALQNVKNLKIIIETSNSKTTEYLRKIGFHIKHLGDIYYLAFKD